MKKVFATLLMMLNTTSALAFQDYLIVADEPVDKIIVEENSAVEVKPIFTIENNKQILTLTVKRKGKAEFSLHQKEKITKFNVKMTDKTTFIEKKQGFEYFVLDTPPEGFKFDLPPGLREAK